MKTLHILGVVAACGLMAPLAPAQNPPALYGVAHIKNETTANATIYYKWGKSGKWKVHVIKPGKTSYFSWAYDGNSQSSPDLHVRLDVDFKGGGVKYVEYVLSRGASPDNDSAQYGHHFSIRPVAEGSDIRFIDKVTKSATVKVTDKNSSKPDVK